MSGPIATDNTPRVRVVIVNYRTAGLVIDCLHSLRDEAAEHPVFAVTVVDNASGDGSADRLREAIEREGWEGWASLMPLDHNGGFSCGNNAALRADLQSERPAAYYLLLNPDTVVRLGAVGALIEFMDQHPDAGLAGSRLEAPDGSVQPSAHPALTPWRELDRSAKIQLLSRLLRSSALPHPPQDQPHPGDWISGASFMVRREVFETIGLLDEGYFLYFDEVDFCTRARQAGWSVWCVPDSRVAHLEGESTGIKRRRVRRASYWYNSRRRFFVKTYGVRGLIAADLCRLVGHLFMQCRRLIPIRRRPYDEPKRFLLDMLGGDLKAILSGEAFRIRGSEKII